MRRNITLFFFIITALITSFFFVAWVNNTVGAYHLYSDLVDLNREFAARGSQTAEVAPQLQDSISGSTEIVNRIKAGRYKGIEGFERIGFLSIDFSTVTTFIPFFGFLLIASGFFRIWKNKDFGDEFPFFKSHDSIVMALGLIGTLWGMIMIGFYPEDQIQISALMYCFFTALFSSLCAAIWVFVIAKVFRTFMVWWNRKVWYSDVVENQDGLILTLEKLNYIASDAATELRNTSHEVSNFKRNVVRTYDELHSVIETLSEFKERTGVDAYHALQEVCGDISSTLQGMHQQFELNRETAAGLQLITEKVAVTVEQHTQFIQSIESRFQCLEQQKENAESKVEGALKIQVAAEKTAEAAIADKAEADKQLEQIKKALI